MPFHVAITSANQARFRWGEEVDGIKFYSLSDPQLDVLAALDYAKYTAAIAGTGSGKTALNALACFRQLNQYRQKEPTRLWRALIVSPTVPIFESSQLGYHIRSVFANTPYEGVWHSQKKTYEGNHFEIVCKSADNDPASLTGGQYHFVIGDEVWAISNPEVFAEMRRRTNEHNAPILVSSTPNVNGWLYDEIYLPYINGDPEYYVRQWATKENPVKTAAEHEAFLKSELRKLGPERFSRMYEGQFTAATGLIYSAFKSQDAPEWPVVPSLDVLPSPAVRAFGGIDWGWSDPASAHLFVECEDNHTYCVDEIYGSNIPTDVFGAKVRALQDKWSLKFGSKYGELLNKGFLDLWYCDTSRPESRELISRYGIPAAEKRVANIEAGIAITDQLYRFGTLKVFDNCTNLIREARQYAYDDKGKIKPRQSDHAMESMRLACSSYYYGRPLMLAPVPETPVRIEEVTEVAKRLGHVMSEDELRQKEIEAEQERHRQWQIYMMNADC